MLVIWNGRFAPIGLEPEASSEINSGAKTEFHIAISSAKPTYPSPPPLLPPMIKLPLQKMTLVRFTLMANWTGRARSGLLTAVVI